MNRPKHAASPDELLSPEQLSAISGFEFIDGMRTGRFPSPPIAKTLNYALTEVEEGRVVFEGAPEFAAYNPLGGAHGGWFGTLLDSCMACAVQTTLPKGKGYTTVEYKITILRPGGASRPRRVRWWERTAKSLRPGQQLVWCSTYDGSTRHDF